MVQYQGVDYLEAPRLLAQALANIHVPRTDAALACAQGTLTFITHRITYTNEIVDLLPVIAIDINDAVPIRYRYDGSVLERGMPLSIGILTPMTAYLDTTLTKEQMSDLIIQADEDIKTLVGDVEAILNDEKVRRVVAKHLELSAATIMHDDLEFQAGSGIRARVAELLCYAWNPVAGH